LRQKKPGFFTKILISPRDDMRNPVSQRYLVFTNSLSALTRFLVLGKKRDTASPSKPGLERYLCFEAKISQKKPGFLVGKKRCPLSETGFLSRYLVLAKSLRRKRVSETSG